MVSSSVAGELRTADICPKSHESQFLSPRNYASVLKLKHEVTD